MEMGEWEKVRNKRRGNEPKPEKGARKKKIGVCEVERPEG